jgi:hypothetical protein
MGSDTSQFDSLRSALVMAVQQEIRGEFMLNAPSNCPVPPPSDIQGESAFLYSFLRGGGAHGLVAEDFFVPIHQLLFRSGGRMEPSGVFVFVEREMRCPMAKYLQDVIDAIMDPPMLPLEGAAYAPVIKEASKARKLILWLDKLDMGLRTGTMTTDDVRAKMGKWANAGAPT